MIIVDGKKFPGKDVYIDILTGKFYIDGTEFLDLKGKTSNIKADGSMLISSGPPKTRSEIYAR